jgi:hypothetical protein
MVIDVHNHIVTGEQLQTFQTAGYAGGCFMSRL